MTENVQHKKLVDSGGGFFLDEDNLIEEKQKELDIVEEPCKYLNKLNQLENNLNKIYFRSGS